EGAAAAPPAALLDSKVLADTDLHTRLAAILRLAELPASDAAGKALYAASLEPSNFGDRWLWRALYLPPPPPHPPQDPVPDAAPRRPGEADHRRAADRPAPRARPARLAAAGRGRA